MSMILNSALERDNRLRRAPSFNFGFQDDGFPVGTTLKAALSERIKFKTYIVSCSLFKAVLEKFCFVNILHV